MTANLFFYEFIKKHDQTILLKKIISVKTT